ncbi:MAG: hypothetical protein VKK94_04305 [Cyanobacteriota bacterium]|nr:hypothetical protein [Cyanobacteriota bacterium]
MRRSVLLALGLPALLAVVQQQWLLRQPPRLLALRQAPASSGPAALQVRFSRPMLSNSLQQGSALQPPLAHRWLGSGSQLLLTLAEGERITAPLELQLAGHDLRGLALPPSRWSWDPRPRVVAVVRVPEGEQLQLRGHDNRWQPISPVWPAIPVMLPLGDGSGVAAASRSANGRLRLWRIPIQQKNLQRWPREGHSLISTPVAAAPQPLRAEPVIFAHFSSNRRGDLMVQSGGLDPGSSETRLLATDGGRQSLPWRASGPLQLAPEGGAVLVPDADGLHLQALPPLPSRRQTLPGSRDLSSFCPQAGRALLVRHWPDFRRSLELVEPGQAPRQLWIGTEAVLSTACSRGGQRVWVLLLDGIRQPQLSLLMLDSQGRRLARRLLRGWEAEPGTGLHWDPSTGQLLAVLRPEGDRQGRRQPARAVLIDSRGLGLRPLAPEVRQAEWLPAG